MSGEPPPEGAGRPRKPTLADVDADPGLCGTCVHLRLQASARSVFVRCALAEQDPRFPRYPPLPVRACAGYQPVALRTARPGTGHDGVSLEGTLKVLGTIAGQYTEGSPEEVALRSAAQALLYVQQTATEAKFRDWLAELDRPLTALQVLHAKLMGIEIPHELRDETLREIDAVLEKLAAQERVSGPRRGTSHAGPGPRSEPPLRPERREPVIERHRSAETAAMNLPFSDSVRVGETLYVSGQLGHRPGELELVPGGIEAEARQALQNLQRALERGGSSLAGVVKCTIFLADMSEWPAFNAVYREFFPDALPARSALGASGLALGARVELECIAVVGATAG